MDESVHIKVRTNTGYRYVMPAFRRNVEGNFKPLLTEKKEEARVFDSASEADEFLKRFQGVLPKATRIVHANEIESLHTLIPINDENPERVERAPGEPMEPNDGDY